MINEKPKTYKLIKRCKPACKHGFFRAEEFSWNYDTSINIHKQHEKERPCRLKISVVFAWKLLKMSFSTRNFAHRWSQSGHFFCKLGHFFLIFEKGRKTYAPTPSSYASKTLWSKKWIEANDQPGAAYSNNKKIKFETSMLR